MEGEEGTVTAAGSLLEQCDGDMFRRTELGRKVMGRGSAVAGQHEAHGDFDAGVASGDVGDLGELLAAVHREAAASVAAIGVRDLAARLHRVMIVEHGLRRLGANRFHLVDRSNVPVLEPGLGQAGNHIRRRI